MKEKEFWKQHWNSHKKLEDDNPFVQVARTKNKKPISSESWRRSLEYLDKKISLSKNDILIDLCCGNGLLTQHFSPMVKEVVAIDYSQKLLDSFLAKDEENVKVMNKDVTSLDFTDLKYNKLIFYFAIQHFSEEEVMQLLNKIKNSIDENGILYIGDIPDIDLKWEFFYTEDYKAAYFDSLIKGEPSVGSWFKRDFFINASKYLGFKEVHILDQPEFMLNHNHRFDVLLKS